MAIVTQWIVLLGPQIAVWFILFSKAGKFSGSCALFLLILSDMYGLIGLLCAYSVG